MIYLVIGRRKKGKTTLARYLSLRTQQRVSIDPRGLLPRESTFIVSDGRSAETALQNNVPDITLVPRRDTQHDYERTIEAVANSIEKHPPLSFTLLIDETRFIPDLLTSGLDWILRCSDPECINIILTCHRPQDVKTDIRAIADNWLMFQMTQQHDIKVVEGKSEHAARLLPRLPDRHFIDWNDAEGKLTVFSDPKTWYVPLRSVGTHEERAEQLIEGGKIQHEREPELF